MAARQTARTAALAVPMFQSTRDHEWPRDPPTATQRVATDCFNPRATTNGRATATALCHAPNLDSVSIHARPRMAARHHVQRTSSGMARVSIHARPRMAARRQRDARCTSRTVFQSTRDHEWPRDQQRADVARWRDRVSIHARPRMAARRQAPLRLSMRQRGFNPRATTNGRATTCGTRHQVDRSVSIHARPRMAARRLMRCRPDDDARFQSTRDHEWPRDGGHSMPLSATA